LFFILLKWGRGYLGVFVCESVKVKRENNKERVRERERGKEGRRENDRERERGERKEVKKTE
jgi:hypothetical protein